MSRLGEISSGTKRAFKGMRDLSSREQRRLHDELRQMRGLMPLLMKPRNHQQWTPEDKAQLSAYVKRIAKLSPYLAVLVMPGGFFALPALAWWLDRRRGRTRASA